MMPLFHLFINNIIMNEEILVLFSKNIAILEEKCHLLEIENAILKTENTEKNKFCEHLLAEIDYFKSKIDINKLPIDANKPISIEETKVIQPIVESKFQLDFLLNDYDINKNENTLIELFDKFPDKHKYILTAIKDSLPANIQELAKKYQFEEGLKLLLRSNKLTIKSENKEKYGPQELVNKYITNFNLNRKFAAYKYLKQALIHYPLTYKEQFIDKIQAYLFDDFNEKFAELFDKLYGENGNKKGKYLDYSTETIPNLIKITASKIDSRQRGLLVVKRLQKKKRPEADIIQFKAGINNYLKKKI